MKEFELNAIKKLIEVYSELYEENINVKHIEQIYNELIPASTLLRSSINQAVSNLFIFAYSDVDMGRNILSKYKIGNLLNNLKKIKIEL